VRAVRESVGPDFHLQVKISVREQANAFLFWLKRGNKVEESVEVCRRIEEAGADAIHVSAGSTFPHPLNPAGDLPLKDVRDNYDGLISSGSAAFRNYLLYRIPVINWLMRRRWSRPADRVEGMNLPESRAVKRAVSIPVLCTGGFQTASVVRKALADGDCDAVTIARPLIANRDLLARWQAGEERPPRPCTFSNKCLYNLLESPLGCYDQSRYSSREEMLREIYEVFDPPPVTEADGAGRATASLDADR
jgi:2,4-dienoyl-CoA reductase-like NADH-dependent reductase (Old Yellow Enzyme family)